ncbi:MAG: STAS-like domain-containing protein [Rhizomicrobium sp.]|nr:STAS-like domain-containing protein [Rhizomicrobium sp.]
MVIHPLNHVKDCNTWDSGAAIACLIRKGFADTDLVVVSFSGITDVPSSFVNAAFISLLDSYSFDYIKTHLKVTDASRQIIGMIKRRFEFVTSQVAAA